MDGQLTNTFYPKEKKLAMVDSDLWTWWTTPHPSITTMPVLTCCEHITLQSSNIQISLHLQAWRLYGKASKNQNVKTFATSRISYSESQPPLFPFIFCVLEVSWEVASQDSDTCLGSHAPSLDPACLVCCCVSSMVPDHPVGARSEGDSPGQVCMILQGAALLCNCCAPRRPDKILGAAKHDASIRSWMSPKNDLGGFLKVPCLHHFYRFLEIKTAIQCTAQLKKKKKR